MRGSSVTALGLDWSHLRDEGVSALAAVLPETSLRELDLSRNGIGVAGAHALAAALKSSCVRTLRLFASCEMGEEGGMALLEGIRDSSVIDIELDNCNIGKETFRKIKEAMEANRARSFVLRLEVQTFDDELLTLKLRTLAGTVAAEMTWSLDRPAKDLPEAVLTSMRSSGFQPGLSTLHLKLVRPDGSL